MKKDNTKNLTLKSNQASIVKQFLKTIYNGGEVNLTTEDGFLYAVGGKGAIVCKIENNKHYSFQQDRNMWVEL